MNGACPATGKRRYATARAAHLAVTHAYWGKRTQKQPRRAYYCKQCQGYHLSAKGEIWQRRARLQHAKRRRAVIEDDFADSEFENAGNTSSIE